MSSSDIEQALTTAEAAAMIGIPRRSVVALWQAGKIRGANVSLSSRRNLRFRKEEIENYLLGQVTEDIAAEIQDEE